jgi:hypothetical protein
MWSILHSGQICSDGDFVVCQPEIIVEFRGSRFRRRSPGLGGSFRSPLAGSLLFQSPRKTSFAWRFVSDVRGPIG